MLTVVKTLVDTLCSCMSVLLMYLTALHTVTYTVIVTGSCSGDTRLLDLTLISFSPCRPSSLDAYVFGHLAPILNCKLPNGKLQQHLKSLDNLTNFCTNILQLYFPKDGRGEAHNSPRADFSSPGRGWTPSRSLLIF